MCSPAAVSADALGLGVRGVLVAVGTIVSKDTGAGGTTGICTSTHTQIGENQEIHTCRYE